MQITLTLNNKKLTADVAPDALLIDFVRSHGCLSVKRGCETSNCGLCTVFLDDKPVLSCSVLAVRADGRRVTTLEACRTKPPSSAPSSPIRAQSSAASATRASS